MVNASPDLSSQIEASPALQPRPHSLRNTPIAGVLLTNADLDHVLGLFVLREGPRLNVWATREVRDTIDSSLGLTAALAPFCGIDWHEPPLTAFAPLSTNAEAESPLAFRAIDLGGSPPPFAKSPFPGGSHSVAYQFLDRRTGGRLLVAPDVARVGDGLLLALSDSDAVLFDGTFWSADELPKVKHNAPKAQDMGHVTIKDCSLDLLGRLGATRKIYLHINNTNPVLAPDSEERAAVLAAGVVIGEDGMEFEV